MTRNPANPETPGELSSHDRELPPRAPRLDDFGDVLLVPDIAVVLRTSPRTVKRHLRAGTFPIVTIDGIDKRVRFAKADVERFLRR